MIGREKRDKSVQAALSVSLQPLSLVTLAGMNIRPSTSKLTQLSSQNDKLDDLCSSLEEEITYLKLREKKIMYLIHLLQ